MNWYKRFQEWLTHHDIMDEQYRAYYQDNNDETISEWLK